MTRLVHIGDIHAAAGPRNADRYRVLEQIKCETLALSDLGCIVIPGDFDHQRMGIEDKNGLAGFVQQLADAAPVIACVGNHDLPGDLDFLALIGANYPIRVITTPQVIRERLRTGEWASIFVMPYPTKAGLTAAGVAPGDVNSEGAAALDAIFTHAGALLAEAKANGDLVFAIGHFNTVGAIASCGQPQIGKEIEVSATHAQRLPAGIYIGANHIHRAQRISGVHYPGSICRLDWGEIEPKGYLQVVLHDDSTFAATTMPLDVPPMYHVEAQLTREGFTWQATAGPGGGVQPAPASWKGCEVRVRYTVRQSERSILANAPLFAEFADALKLELEPIVTPDRALRCPEVAAARTLEEKLAAWFTVSGIPMTAGVLDKLALLAHGDPLQLLTDVQRAIASLEQPEKETVAA